MRLLSDEVWQVIKDYLAKYSNYDAPEELRSVLEKFTNIEVFDGGVFIARDNEFDLFVVPEKRGKWRIRSIVANYLDRMGSIHSTIVVRINECNAPSLRLAQHFGFREVSRENGVIRLER